MAKVKMVCFDMDGVLAGLYNVEGWLNDLENENTRPYEIAKPLVNMTELAETLNELKKIGYQIAIISWLAKNATHEYDERVRVAKKNWLDKYGFPYDEIHLVKYGTTKANCVRYKIAETKMLIDDNEQIRKGWALGETVDGTTNFLEVLKKLVREG